MLAMFKTVLLLSLGLLFSSSLIYWGLYLLGVSGVSAQDAISASVIAALFYLPSKPGALTPFLYLIIACFCTYVSFLGYTGELALAGIVWFLLSQLLVKKRRKI